MAVVIVDKTKCIIGVFGREAEGIGEREVAGGENHFTERGVFVVGVDGAVGCGDEFGNVLIAVDGIQLRLGVGLVEDKRACLDRFRRIPDEAIGGRGAVWLPAVAGDADVIVVGEAIETVGRAVGGNFKILPTTSLMIERHGDERGSVGVKSG